MGKDGLSLLPDDRDGDVETAAEFRSELELVGEGGEVDVVGEVAEAKVVGVVGVVGIIEVVEVVEVVEAEVEVEVEVVEVPWLLASAAAMRLVVNGDGGGRGPKSKETPAGQPKTPLENVGVRLAVDGADTAGRATIGGGEARGRATTPDEAAGDGLAIGGSAVGIEGGAVSEEAGVGEGLGRERVRALPDSIRSVSSFESQ